MKLLDLPCAFVDLETTGSAPNRDAITEIGLLVSDEDNNLSTWEQLINPGRSISGFIAQLTGITNQMVADKPYFDEIANDLHERLSGLLFVAHNARFDYGFLKVAFESLGFTFKPKIICTLKLAKLLFPKWRRHSLDAICREIGYPQNTKHRAMADVNAMYAFLCYALAMKGEEAVNHACRQQISKPSVPMNLDPTEIEALPDTPGVYYFYGQEGLLYVGKSIKIRSRVKSHFAADHRSQIEMTLSRSVQRIEYDETAGELGALLLENQQIKSLSPVYNRKQRRYKTLWMWRPVINENGFITLELDDISSSDWRIDSDVYGPYRSRYAANASIRKIVREKRLCLKVLGMEAGTGPCFARQLNKCHGACEGLDPVVQHNFRLLESLTKLKLHAWPFKGPVGIKEVSLAGDKEDIHVVHQWVYIGKVTSVVELQNLLNEPTTKMFDIETYRILQKYINSPRATILPL